MFHFDVDGMAACGCTGKPDLTDDRELVNCKKCLLSRKFDRGYYSGSICRARKEYICSRCGGVIKVGDLHKAMGQSGKHKRYEYKYHLRCDPRGFARHETSDKFESTLALLRIRPMFSNESSFLPNVYASQKHKGINIERAKVDGVSIYFYAGKRETAFLMMSRVRKWGGYELGRQFGIEPQRIREIQREHPILGFYPFCNGESIL